MNNYYLKKPYKLKAGGTASKTLLMASERSTSKLTTNYSLMLQLYSLTKKEATSTTKLKAAIVSSKDAVRVENKSKFSFRESLIALLHQELLLLKTVSPEISIASEMIFNYGATLMLTKLQRSN